MVCSERTKPRLVEYLRYTALSNDPVLAADVSFSIVDHIVYSYYKLPATYRTLARRKRVECLPRLVLRGLTYTGKHWVMPYSSR